MLRPSAASHARTDADRSTPATTRSSLLFERLRAETADAHRELESRMDLASDTLDVPRYVELLRNFRRANGAYESVAGRFLPDRLRPMFESRRKTALLDADLDHFGARADTHPDDLAGLEGVIGRDPNAAIGAMYVFEGSTLGGAVVARHLEQRLGLSTLRGRNYFTPYPGYTGHMWREFRRQVDELVGDDRATCDAIVRSAGTTFGWLAHVLPRTH